MTLVEGFYDQRLSTLRDRAKLLAGRPSNDVEFDSPDWLELLVMGERYWYMEIATHVPEALLSPPLKLARSVNELASPIEEPEAQFFYFYHWISWSETNDNSLSPTPVRPLYVSWLRDKRIDGSPLSVGESGHDREADLWRVGASKIVWGEHAAVQGGAGGPQPVLMVNPEHTVTLPDGAPWAQWIAPPRQIANPQDSYVIELPHIAVNLAVYRALVLWSKRTDRDPSKWEEEEARLWSGDPRSPGTTGVLTSLKTMFPPTSRAYMGHWTHHPSLGR